MLTLKFFDVHSWEFVLSAPFWSVMQDTAAKTLSSVSIIIFLFNCCKAQLSWYG